MRKIKYFEEEISVEEYITNEILANKGTQSICFKEDLEKLCDFADIKHTESMTKKELLDLLFEAKAVDYKLLAEMFHIGVSSKVYQETFKITHQEVKRLETHGVLKVVGSYRFRAFGKYNYAPLYDIYQYAEMSDEDMQTLLEQYPKGCRVKKDNSKEQGLL